MAAPLILFALPRRPRWRRCGVCRWFWRQRVALFLSGMLWALIVGLALVVVG